jgi:hypothetical protein
MTVCEAFGIFGEDNIKNYTLYRLDNFGEPAFPIRKEKASFLKNNVYSGDILALKNNLEISNDEKITLVVNLTLTGLPEDCIFIGNLDVRKE